MFQQYQYAIMLTNFNRFAYLLMHSTHSSSMSPQSAVFIGFQIHFCCFNNYLHPVTYRNFNAFSRFSFPVVCHCFSCMCNYTYRKMKVLKYNQMVNAKLLIMPNCKQLNIWLSLTRGMQMARKHIIAHR